MAMQYRVEWYQGGVTKEPKTRGYRSLNSVMSLVSHIKSETIIHHENGYVIIKKNGEHYATYRFHMGKKSERFWMN